MTREPSENVTYIVRCSDGSFYTGWTNRIGERLAAHNAGTGSKYTRSRRPVELVYLERFQSKEEAMAREYRIKRLSRKEKLQLIEGSSGTGTSAEEDGQTGSKALSS